MPLFGKNGVGDDDQYRRHRLKKRDNRTLSISPGQRFSIFGVIFAFRKPFLRFFNLLLKYCPSFRTVHVQCTYAGFANAQSRAALFCFFATFLCEICATKLGLPRMKERKREVCMVSNSSVLVVLLYGTHVSSFLQGKKVILRIVQK